MYKHTFFQCKYCEHRKAVKIIATGGLETKMKGFFVRLPLMCFLGMKRTCLLGYRSNFFPVFCSFRRFTLEEPFFIVNI